MLLGRPSGRDSRRNEGAPTCSLLYTKLEGSSGELRLGMEHHLHSYSYRNGEECEASTTAVLYNISQVNIAQAIRGNVALREVG